MAPPNTAAVVEIPKCVDREAQPVDIVQSHISDNTCLRISNQQFSTARRDTPAYSRLLAVSNIYGYMVAGTPTGLSVFMTSDAESELAQGKSKGTNTAITLSARKEIDLTRYGNVTHVAISADELQVLAATLSGSILVFSAAELVMSGSTAVPTRTIDVGEELRDIRTNPHELPTAVAVLTLAGSVLIADLATGTTKQIVSSGDSRITAICWSRKGKQIVCGDADAALTQRLPSDGTIKRTIKPQAEDGNIAGGSVVLALDWLDTYTFFAVYGLPPDGFFTPGSGGGGSGIGDEDDGFEDNMTSAYVITQAGKLAPMQWLYAEDPCSSMMCPTRYPGFHIASIGAWGASAQNILIMAGTGSDATMTIGQALRSTDSAELEWTMWDIDGAMAVMPLSAIDTSSDGSMDTFPIGMAIDYTPRRDLPPVVDDGERVGPVPILWVLNTDACLLGYRICNMYEMKRNTRCPLIVEQVKPLPGVANVAPASANPPAFAPARAFGSLLGAAASSTSAGSFGAPASSSLSFGSSSSPAFGKASSIAPAIKAPSALGVAGQPVFGSTSKGSGVATAFGGFGSAALPAGKSIFDAPSSGPSVFDTADKAASALPFGAAVAADSSKSSNLLAVGSSKSPFSKTGDTTQTRGLEPASKVSNNVPAPVSFGSATKQPLVAAFEDGISSNLFESVRVQPATAKPKPFSHIDPRFASAPSTSSADNLIGDRMDSVADKEPRKKKEELRKKEEDQRKKEADRLRRDEEDRRKEEEAQRKQDELVRRNEQARLDAIQHELEEKSQTLINQQFIATCNSFDRDLNALALSVKQTGSAIARVRSAHLPPIPMNSTVQARVPVSVSSISLAIDDTEAWNRIADALLEALDVSRDELQASHRTVSKQQAGYIKTETKREEICRILDSAASTMSLPNATVDGGLNPLQRDYQRRLKSSFAMIGKRTADVEQVVLTEANRMETERQALPPSLRAPTIDSLQRTLNNVSKAARQRNSELDELTKIVDEMAIGAPSDCRQRRTQPLSPLSMTANSTAALPIASRTRPTSLANSGVLRTAASGIPWSPDSLHFSTPALGRRERGFGLRFEDLVVSDGPASLASAVPHQSLGSAYQPTASNLPKRTDALGTNPNFPHTQVRELTPRSTKLHRKASLVLDSDSAALGHEAGDGTIISATSSFSNAAAYLQARKQRSLVRDALTRPSRSAMLIQSPASTATRSPRFGKSSSNTAMEPTPMPNLERYVKAFGKLEITEPVPNAEPEAQAMPSALEPKSAADPLPVAPAESAEPSIGGRKSDQWQCSVCELLSPECATACVVCESPRPGVGGSSSAPFGLAFTSKPPISGVSGFKPSGGLTLASQSSAPGPATSSSAPGLFGGKPKAPFPSFAPPVAATPATASLALSAATAPTVAPAPAFSGFKPSGGFSLTLSAATAPTAAPAPAFSGFKPSSGFSLTRAAGNIGSDITFGAAAKQMPSFAAFVPPTSKGQSALVAQTDKVDFSPAQPSQLSVGVEEERWTCEVCELKSPSRATACVICEAPRPTASLDSKPLAVDDIGANPIGPGDGSDSASTGCHSRVGSDADEESDDVYSEDQYSDESAEEPESGASDSEADIEYDSGSASGSGSDIESDAGLNSGLDAEPGAILDAESDVELEADSNVAATNDSDTVTQQPTLSYADAAKAALEDHNDDEADSEHQGVQASDQPAGLAAKPTATSEDDLAGQGLVSAATAESGKHEHEHDSDGFVHVSQLEPELQDNDDVSPSGDDLESTVDTNADVAVCAAAADIVSSEKSVSSSLNAAESSSSAQPSMSSALAGPSNLTSSHFNLDHSPSDASDTESKILAAVSDELDRGIPEAPRADALELQSSAEAIVDAEAIDDAEAIGDAEAAPPASYQLDPCLVRLLSGVSVAQVVDSAVNRPAEPTGLAIIDDGKSVPAIVDSAAATIDPAPVDIEQLSPVDTVAMLTPVCASPEVKGVAELALDLGGMDVGLASVRVSTVCATEQPKAMHLPAAEPSSDIAESAAADKPNSVSSSSPSSPPAASNSDAKPLFKAGRLGNFGNQLGKTAFNAGTAFSPSSSSQTLPETAAASALPRAFSVSSSVTTPAFGSKLDRPAFGVASMSSFASSSQPGKSATGSSESLASIGKLATGFSSRASSSINPFAAYRSSDPQPTGSALETTDADSKDASPQVGSINSQSPAPKIDSSPRPMSASGIAAPTAQRPSSKDADPIRSIIDGSESDMDNDGDCHKEAGYDSD